MTVIDATTTASARIQRRERTGRRHSLAESEGDMTQRTVVLNRDETIMGRSADAHIRLSSNQASRHHAMLRVRGTDCILIDNDSQNGVMLNGVKIHSAVLRDGDVLQVANTVFVYHED